MVSYFYISDFVFSENDKSTYADMFIAKLMLIDIAMLTGSIYQIWWKYTNT